MKVVEILFWIAVFVVFYTYIGYGLLLYLLVRIKRMLKKSDKAGDPDEWPDVTLFITAYNEEEIVQAKMANTRALDYPSGKLHVYWVIDGTTDRTPEKLARYEDVEICYSPERKGKTAAINHGMEYVRTPFVIFTDANAMLNQEAVKEMMRCFQDEKTGCVSGEKRIGVAECAGASTAGEGFYWKYESALKRLDSELCSAVGAAGELFAIRTALFEKMEPDVLLDDFILSMKIARQGYRIAYCAEAYAQETGSATLQEEEKRKIRIAAGGTQSILRLLPLLDVFRYGCLSFQYISHRVLRWSVTPVLLFSLLPLSLALALWSSSRQTLYLVLFVLQAVFYCMAWIGWRMERKKLRVKMLFIPCYFTFMNVNVFRGWRYLRKNKGVGAWEKSKRA